MGVPVVMIVGMPEAVLVIVRMVMVVVMIVVVVCSMVMICHKFAPSKYFFKSTGSGEY